MQVDSGNLQAYYEPTYKERDRESYGYPTGDDCEEDRFHPLRTQELRQSILEQAQHSDGNLAEELYGALGQGTWDEYDWDLDWQLFCGMSQSIADFKGELP